MHPPRNNDTHEEEEDAEVAMDRETRFIMKQRIAESTRNNYETRNINFILWIFDNREKYGELLEPSFSRNDVQTGEKFNMKNTITGISIYCYVVVEKVW